MNRLDKAVCWVPTKVAYWSPKMTKERSKKPYNKLFHHFYCKYKYFSYFCAFYEERVFQQKSHVKNIPTKRK